MFLFFGNPTASEASEAIKLLQFHSFGTTFGASEAPGHGASVYDGLEVDFEIDPTKKIEIWADPGRHGATRGRPGATRKSKITKFQHAKIRKFEYAKMPKFENAKIHKFQIRKFTKINFAIKRLQFHSFEATFGASGAPGRGDADYDGFGADFQIDSENGPGAAGIAGIRKIDEKQTKNKDIQDAQNYKNHCNKQKQKSY